MERQFRTRSICRSGEGKFLFTCVFSASARARSYFARGFDANKRQGACMASVKTSASRMHGDALPASRLRKYAQGRVGQDLMRATLRLLPGVEVGGVQLRIIDRRERARTRACTWCPRAAWRLSASRSQRPPPPIVSITSRRPAAREPCIRVVVRALHGDRYDD